LTLAALAAGSAGAASSEARSQLAFGIQMAQRGLWEEALFRFRAARERAPEDPRVLNNLAVACEATGRFDEALEVYRAALKVTPEDRGIKLNYSRFAEFYQGFRPRPASSVNPQAPPGDKPVEQPVPTPGDKPVAGDHPGAGR